MCENQSFFFLVNTSLEDHEEHFSEFAKKGIGSELQTTPLKDSDKISDRQNTISNINNGLCVLLYL